MGARSNAEGQGETGQASPTEARQVAGFFYCPTFRAESVRHSAMALQSIIQSPPVLGAWQFWDYPAGAFEVSIWGVPTSVTHPHLVLDNFGIYPSSHATSVPAGHAGMLRCATAFFTDIKLIGYTHVRIIGQRVSGARPNRAFDLTIAL